MLSIWCNSICARALFSLCASSFVVATLLLLPASFVTAELSCHSCLESSAGLDRVPSWGSEAPSVIGRTKTRRYDDMLIDVVTTNFRDMGPTTHFGISTSFSIVHHGLRLLSALLKSAYLPWQAKKTIIARMFASLITPASFG